MQLNKKSLSDQIKSEIRDRIINVDINQGEKIDVPELEKEFDVSRAPVREALQSLVDEGLVEVKSRVGYFAVQLTSKQIRDICELRKLFEIYALKHSINRIPKEKVKKLEQETLKLKEDNFDKDNLRTMFDRTDEELHSLIISSSDNYLLKDFTERIHNLIALTRHLNQRIDEALEEHLLIINAILNNKEEKAKKALVRHLDNVEEEVLNNKARKTT